MKFQDLWAASLPSTLRQVTRLTHTISSADFCLQSNRHPTSVLKSAHKTLRKFNVKPDLFKEGVENNGLG